MKRTTFRVEPRYVPGRAAMIRKNRVIGRWHWEVNEDLMDTPGRRLPIAFGTAETWERAMVLVQLFLEFDAMKHRWRHS